MDTVSNGLPLHQVLLQHNDAADEVQENQPVLRRTPRCPRYKVLLLGKYGVGKTSLFQRFDNNQDLPPSMLGTMGVNETTMTISINDVMVKLTISDSSDPAKWTISNTYFTQCHAIMIVYDATNPDAFNEMDRLLNYVNQIRQEPVVKMIIGNKSDLWERKVILHTEAQNYADSIGALFFETSALHGDNVEEAFITLLAHLFENVRPI